MATKSFNHPVYEALKDKRFILASTSPRRSQILTQLGFKFEVVASNFPEDLDKSKYSPSEYVLNTAIGKAIAVWNEMKAQNEKIDLILSADTVVVCNDKIFEKPKNIEENIKMLKYMRDCGCPQIVMSGVVLLIRIDNTYKLEKIVESSKVYMDYENISDDFINSYVNTEEGLTVAGGYRIQGLGALFMKGIEGDFYNVVGLPFRSTFKLIEKSINNTTTTTTTTIK
ncbi:hypothetical protein PACTADRAFT_33197 [Pachysolen tannophilus NRRL Y-2460]|uniref:Maf-like protein n=1 Tax=Pachysolen tannophilus NRRL Y-2460 TaxID=669874 RepID=A0A1E4TW67_PACTA|nr:hypothetical protein PACTADRAFT_33197 [Pachysolen tannophilus NRRL Y-2460]